MAVKFISVKCPDCGASLNIEKDRNQAYCTYCGAKIIIDKDNEYTIRTVDEAKITESETERLIRLKELEIEAQEREAKRKARSNSRKTIIFLLFISIMAICVGVSKPAFINPDICFALKMFGTFLCIFMFFLLVLSLATDLDEKDKKRKNYNINISRGEKCIAITKEKNMK